ncbi:MAG: rubrerythrin family protein [Deltaproteobacteria bacterium]|nr:rubrerythrin family protein [Deltaproteobacteria bacterium]
MSERTQTQQNLHSAYVAEAKASIRLLAFAERAAGEGYPQMAHLFRAISAAERVHALAHFRHLNAVGTTEENLQRSFESETGVADAAYKDFVRVAEQEGAKGALTSFSHARDAEAYHAKLYKNAIDHLIGETDTSYFVCTVCGYVATGQPPETCPVCNAPAERFEAVS